MELGKSQRVHLAAAATRFGRFVRYIERTLSDETEAFREASAEQFVENEATVFPPDYDPHRMRFLLSAADLYQRHVKPGEMTADLATTLVELIAWAAESPVRIQYLAECRVFFDQANPADEPATVEAIVARLESELRDRRQLSPGPPREDDNA